MVLVLPRPGGRVRARQLPAVADRPARDAPRLVRPRLHPGATAGRPLVGAARAGARAREPRLGDAPLAVPDRTGPVGPRRAWAPFSSSTAATSAGISAPPRFWWSRSPARPMDRPSCWWRRSSCCSRAGPACGCSSRPRPRGCGGRRRGTRTSPRRGPTDWSGFKNAVELRLGHRAGRARGGARHVVRGRAGGRPARGRAGRGPHGAGAPHPRPARRSDRRLLRVLGQRGVGAQRAPQPRPQPPLPGARRGAVRPDGWVELFAGLDTSRWPERVRERIDRLRPAGRTLAIVAFAIAALVVARAVVDTADLMKRGSNASLQVVGPADAGPGGGLRGRAARAVRRRRRSTSRPAARSRSRCRWAASRRPCAASAARSTPARTTLLERSPDARSYADLAFYKAQGPTIVPEPPGLVAGSGSCARDRGRSAHRGPGAVACAGPPSRPRRVIVGGAAAGAAGAQPGRRRERRDEPAAVGRPAVCRGGRGSPRHVRARPSLAPTSRAPPVAAGR